MCQFGHMTGNPVMDHINHTVYQCGFDWNFLINGRKKLMFIASSNKNGISIEFSQRKTCSFFNP